MEPQNTPGLQFLPHDVNSDVNLASQSVTEVMVAANDEQHIRSVFAVMQREQRRDRIYRRYRVVSSILVLLGFIIWISLSHAHIPGYPVSAPDQLLRTAHDSRNVSS